MAGDTQVLGHNTCGVDVEGVLSELATKRVTIGRIFDSSGNAIYDEIEAGGNSNLVQSTDEPFPSWLVRQPQGDLGERQDHADVVSRRLRM